MGEVGLLIEDMDEPPPSAGLHRLGVGVRIGVDDSSADVDSRPSRGVSTAALEAPPSPRTPAAGHRAVPGAAPNLATRRRRMSPALLAVYGSLSLLNDPRATLGSDSAGKLATLRALDHSGSLDVDVGYWAAHADPTGSLHPLYYTSRVGGKWVQVTTLPQLIAAYPLYRLGGPRAALLLPMLGALLTAFAARALARRLGGGSGWVAFWAIGLATPVAIYALDVWEHSLGLGLMAWGAVLLLDVAAGRGGWKIAGAGGLLFGAAATMRTEALVPLAVGTAIACVTVLVRGRRLAPAVARGLAVVAGAVAALFGEHLLERAVFGVDLRAGRASGTAVAAGTGAVERAKEALTTAVGLNGFAPSTDWLLGGVIVVLVGAGAWCLARRPARTPIGAVLFALAVGLYLARFSVGLGYVPGLLTACPLAAAGLALAWSRRSCRLPALLACLVVPDRVDRPVLREREAAVGWPLRVAVGFPTCCGRSRGAPEPPDCARRDDRALARSHGLRDRVAE